MYKVQCQQNSMSMRVYNGNTRNTQCETRDVLLNKYSLSLYDTGLILPYM